MLGHHGALMDLREGHTQQWTVEGGTPNTLFRKGIDPSEPTRARSSRRGASVP